MKSILMFICMSLLFSQTVFAKKVVYKYKKYERFDFDALDVEGARSAPGDLSIGPRFKKQFKNKIPERKKLS